MTPGMLKPWEMLLVKNLFLPVGDFQDQFAMMEVTTISHQAWTSFIEVTMFSMKLLITYSSTLWTDLRMVESNSKLQVTTVTQAVVDSSRMIKVRCASLEFVLTVMVHIGELTTGMLKSVAITGIGLTIT